MRQQRLMVLVFLLLALLLVYEYGVPVVYALAVVLHSH